jgi:hypothetical protein
MRDEDCSTVYGREGRVRIDAPKNPNAETTVLAPGHCALEGTKDASLVLFRDADAVIPNSQPRGGAVTKRRS